MDKELARRLLKLVNNQELLGDLNAYLEAREDFLLNSLVTSKDISEVRFIQGQIKEIRSLLNLRDTVRGEMKGGQIG